MWNGPVFRGLGPVFVLALAGRAEEASGGEDWACLSGVDLLAATLMFAGRNGMSAMRSWVPDSVRRAFGAA